MKLLGDLRFYLLLALPGALICYLAGGRLGAAGFALGVLGPGLSMLILWMVIRLLGQSIAGEPAPRFGTIAVLFAFLLKLPILVGSGMLSQRLGGDAPTCFLVGLALVYFALVGWAQARSQSSP